MAESAPVLAKVKPAALVVVNPSGTRTRIPIEPLPFLIGRQAGNHLVLRDNRISRTHAHIIAEAGEYYVEDLESRHGVYINGAKVQRYKLQNSDRIEFGIQDSYRLIFSLEEEELQRLLEQMSTTTRPAAGAATGNMGKLRALMEVARALQSSLSTHDVLSAVVDAALAVTRAERGFLLLKNGDDLEISVSRDQRGMPLAKDDLRVPTHLIHRALKNRRELLSMHFDPHGEGGLKPELSVADLELRSVVCVPLVKVRTVDMSETMMGPSVSETTGLLYLDSRLNAADLSAGNRELLQTLAIEASTILENSRLLEEERSKRKMEEELNIARQIQETLLPRALPATGFFRAAGSSIPSHQVGGDYFDVRQIGPGVWAAVVADVSGKGVSSALLAALLQGAFLLAHESAAQIQAMMERINRFLYQRTGGEKYATLFYCTLHSNGLLRWTNAGHCAPLLMKCDGSFEKLSATSMPLGMMEETGFPVRDTQLNPGEKIIIYTDGVSEAQNFDGVFFDPKRLREAAFRNRSLGSASLHAAIIEEVDAFTEGVEQGDDITLVVLEYRPE